MIQPKAVVNYLYVSFAICWPLRMAHFYLNSPYKYAEHREDL